MKHEEAIPCPVAAVCLRERLLGVLGKGELCWEISGVLSPLLALCQAGWLSVTALARISGVQPGCVL